MFFIMNCTCHWNYQYIHCYHKFFTTLLQNVNLYLAETRSLYQHNLCEHRPYDTMNKNTCLLKWVTYRHLCVFMWGRSFTPSLRHRSIMLLAFSLTLSMSRKRQGVVTSVTSMPALAIICRCGENTYIISGVEITPKFLVVSRTT